METGLNTDASSDLCVCGQQQTMNHMVNVCPFTKFEGICYMNPVMTQSTGWSLPWLYSTRQMKTDAKL